MATTDILGSARKRVRLGGQYAQVCRLTAEQKAAWNAYLDSNRSGTSAELLRGEREMMATLVVRNADGSPVTTDQAKAMTDTDLAFLFGEAMAHNGMFSSMISDAVEEFADNIIEERWYDMANRFKRPDVEKFKQEVGVLGLIRWIAWEKTKELNNQETPN